MWIFIVLAIMVLFLIWCKIPIKMKALIALLIVLSTAFLGDAELLVWLMVIVTVDSIFGKYFR